MLVAPLSAGARHVSRPPTYSFLLYGPRRSGILGIGLLPRAVIVVGGKIAKLGMKEQLSGSDLHHLRFR